MGGFFGVAAKTDCVTDLFYGTDYHSHLGTQRGGLITRNEKGFTRFIHDIRNAQFRSKFTDDIRKMSGASGLGVISDYEDQPLIIASHLGTFGIVTVGAIRNLDALSKAACRHRRGHFSEVMGDTVNPTELVASLICQGGTFEEGIRNVQDTIEGSCSLLLLTEEGVIYAARDKFGRTPVLLGEKPGAYAATLESCAFPNLDYRIAKNLGPGEIVMLTPDGITQVKPPETQMKICAFLWVYYGFPASSYEGINAECVRYNCGAHLARRDHVELDFVAGIPDSGTAHAIGYANEARIPYKRPFVKYTPTWPRSFMPQDQDIRELVARMKLVPITDLIENQRLLFCEDSIVRGTQLKDTVARLYDAGALEIHMRPACPPLVFGCPFLNFSRSRSELDLAARRAVKALEGAADKHLDQYCDPDSDKHHAMLDWIRNDLGLTTLQYQRLDDMVDAIGLPHCQLCTYCWNGVE